LLRRTVRGLDALAAISPPFGPRGLASLRERGKRVILARATVSGA
jgi:hypothetical protein